MSQNSKMLLGALVAAALAIAGYYGLISPQTATSIQNHANQTLGTTPASQQPGAPTQTPTTPPATPAGPTPQNAAPQNPAPATQR